MKKTILIFLVLMLLILLPLLFAQCSNHDETHEFVIADVSEITFEALLSPPYTVEGVWSFIDKWTLSYNGVASDSISGEEGLYKEIAAGLQEILKGKVLHTYIPQKNIKNYDKHVRELLWEHEETIPMYLQLSAGTLPTLTCDDYDITPTLVNLYAFDSNRCYITVGYRNNIEIKGTYYVFYTEEPAVIAELFDFTQAMIARKKTA